VQVVKGSLPWEEWPQKQREKEEIDLLGVA
jgi:hypothetical protein